MKFNSTRKFYQNIEEQTTIKKYIKYEDLNP